MLRRDLDSLKAGLAQLRMMIGTNRGGPIPASGRPPTGNVTPMTARDGADSRLAAIEAAVAEILRRLPPDDSNAGVAAVVR